MKQIIYTLLAGTVLVFSGCGKDDDDNATPSGSREREVEYRVTSPTSGAKMNILYTNETGGFTDLKNVELPKTYKFKRTLKVGDAVNFLAQLQGAGSSSEITGTILLDGTQVKTETGRGNSAQVNIVYVIQ